MQDVGDRGRRAVAAVVALAVLSIGLIVLPAPAASAHTPHDDIFGVAVSPGFAADGTAIVVARGIAYRTSDGGATWDRLVAGLTNQDPLSSVAVTCCEEPTYLVSSPADGIFRSTDGGDAWAPADEGRGRAEVRHLAASPDQPDVAYALTDDGLLRTSDAGASWSAVEGLDGELTAIGLTAGAPDELLLGDAEGRVHRSGDGGATWVRATVPGAGPVRAIGRDTDGRLLVGTEAAGLLRTDEDLERFDAVEVADADDQPVSSLAVEGDTVWVSLADQGTWRSDDDGRTWSPVIDGLTRSTQADEEGYEDRPHFGEVVVAPNVDGAGPTVLLAAFDGLFVLDPGADAWREAELMTSRIVVGLAVSPQYATDETVAVTTYMNGASRSTDGGATWEPINDGIDEEVLYASGEDRFARLFAIAFSPHFADDQTMVATRWSDALTTSDAGDTWSPVAVVPGDDPPLQQFALVFAPGEEPDGSVVLTGSRNGRIHRSLDGGRSYEQVGQVDGSVRSIVAVPGVPGCFLAATQRGIFETDDAGATWTVRTTEVRNAVNLALSPDFATDGIAFAATRRGLWATTDGGERWARSAAAPALGSGYVEGVAVSPAFATDGLVLASVRGAGLWRSTDGGGAFARTATDLASDQLELSNYANATAVPIVFSPAFADDQTVFGFSGDEVLRSRDGADTWEVLDLPVATHEPVDQAAAPAGPGGAASATSSGSRRRAAAVAAASAALAGVAVAVVVLHRRRRARPAVVGQDREP